MARESAALDPDCAQKAKREQAPALQRSAALNLAWGAQRKKMPGLPAGRQAEGRRYVNAGKAGKGRNRTKKKSRQDAGATKESAGLRVALRRGSPLRVFARNAKEMLALRKPKQPRGKEEVPRTASRAPENQGKGESAGLR